MACASSRRTSRIANLDFRRGGSRNANAGGARVSDRNDPGLTKRALRIGVLKATNDRRDLITSTTALDAGVRQCSSEDDEGSSDGLDDLAAVM
jgi:hypothetical protein